MTLEKPTLRNIKDDDWLEFVTGLPSELKLTPSQRLFRAFLRGGKPGLAAKYSEMYPEPTQAKEAKLPPRCRP